MSVLFNRDALLPGDIVQVRSDHFYGRQIRNVLGSYTNHTGMLVRTQSGIWMVAEAIWPRSCLTPIPEYEAAMSKPLDQPGYRIVRVMRFPHNIVSHKDRKHAEDVMMANKLGLKYPIGVARLWVYRFFNNLPWTIRGDWCTRIVWDAWSAVDPSIWIPATGKLKRNPTPRTIENRLVAGVLRDVTNLAIVRQDS